MRVETIAVHEEYHFRNVFKILRARFRHERFDGSMSDEIERIVFERGNAVGVLLYDAENKNVLLIKQFRYPAFLRDQSGWLIEIVAGVIDKGRDGLAVAHSELVEEIGYEVSELTPLCACYLSPGGTTEQVQLYLGYLRQAKQVSAGGGLACEHEDIQLLALPFDEALAMIRRGEICDAKTIIALQQLALMTHT
ncbi:MutT/nudix family protein [Candidatus Moduliflexus flocculans]|uniref:ADP-ribose pyrophosphatase n=1 Tax=Candidatus Moduliflexus flocculans TaxID=1499966 RepID=A0A0S6VR28_9BACT|nr:MutT/nudix family protein [Candidatus Moduliflexus flocculans]